jgi:hypothetical protein
LAAIPAVKCHNSAQLAVTNATWTALTFDTNDYDQGPSAQHSTSSNQSRLVCVQAGVYSVFGTIAWQPNATGYRGIAIRLNGTTYVARLTHASISGTDSDFCTITAHCKLALADYLELLGYQNSTATINTYSPAQLANDVTPAFGWAQVG